MENNQKKILMVVFLIIYIIGFFIFLGFLDPFFRDVLRIDLGAMYLYNSILYFCLFIFTLALWFPLVNGIGPRKASIVCIPFLIIGLLVVFMATSFTQLLFSGFILSIGFSGTLYLICFNLVYNEEKKRIISCGMALIPSLLLVIIFSQLSFSGAIPPLSTPSYIPGASAQTDLALYEIRLSSTVSPIIALVMVIIIMLIVKDVEKQDQIY